MSDIDLREETRGRLISAGVELFLISGYHGTGLAQILERAGAPKGTFYKYFESKEHYCAAVIEAYGEWLAELMEQARLQTATPFDRLRRYFSLQMREYKATNFGGCLLVNLAGEVDDAPMLREALWAVRQRCHAHLRGLINEAQEAGQLRQDAPAEALADILMDAWQGALLGMKLGRSLEPLKSCLGRLMDGLFQPGASSAL